ncbi:MAG: DUF3006 domain-containing protein [Bacillaceae bacterium]|jgi:6-phosphogluconate dehydrogenase (decarboxylating)|uniref:Pyruvate kinase n=2 Tax=Aeribacillus TaxID=1055323 RepID=A0A223E632_9BACI|nr:MULTISPECIES: DUF3006 domain-containing protein [Aeribacillus]REJ15017.1 MAG: DUF3006 domain-containing protein [Bacillaceae bacterium]ASS90575.1 pyruvate kinase [Aeribacillus pallidus]MDR9794548.1 DUF3006 domain-containing protein [Aeribacillus pallidus]MDR9796383.1 DUF3006 domain-containing protein [Aeribacillus pallidus]MED0703635.1 DUF3006 domain-containing protein [Aeribacillus composti]
MKFIIDRFENDIAVCEDENGKIIEILKSQLPKNAETGDVIIQKNNRYYVDKQETSKRRQEIEELMDELFED